MQRKSFVRKIGQISASSIVKRVKTPRLSVLFIVTLGNHNETAINNYSLGFPRLVVHGNG